MNIPLALSDLAAIAPLLILLIGITGLLLIESFHPAPKRYLFSFSCTIFVAALVASFIAPPSDLSLFTKWIRFDPLGNFFTRFFILTGLSITLLSHSFFKHKMHVSQGEFYFLLLCAITGAILIGISADFLTLFIGLETYSLSLYVLCGYVKPWKLSHEAAIKYFFMGALAAAILLYGIALIYGALGTTHLPSLANQYLHLSNTMEMTLFSAGIALITAGLAFKATVVPFHAWAPDVYAGSPTPITALMSVGTKSGALAALAIIFGPFMHEIHPLWNQYVAILACITMIFANFVALQQTHLRRFLAYSGISNAGFLLIPFAAGGPDAIPSLLFYLIIYVTAILGIFTVLAAIDRDDGEDIPMEDLHGLYERSPLLASIMALSLLTLAGMPPTAGFFAKVYLFKVAFEMKSYLLILIGMAITLVSIYYYMRLIALIFTKKQKQEKLQWTWATQLLGIVVLVGLSIAALYPQVIMFLSPVIFAF